MKKLISLIFASAALTLCSCHTTGSSCCATGGAACCATKDAACKVCGKTGAACVCPKHKH
jgi:hypothetical protein